MNKNKRILITLTEDRRAMLQTLMDEDFESGEPVSSYITRLISKEVRRRQEERAKRPAGRPRKEDSLVNLEEEEPQVVSKLDEPIYPHPDQIMNAGVMLTKSEIEAYYAFKAGLLQSE